MKRMNIILFLFLIILLVGCKQNIKKNEEVELKSDIQDQIESEASKNLLVWKDLSEYSNENIPFLSTSYTPKVPHYGVDSQLSNIENIHQFYGLSTEQMSKLAQNGFIILDPNPERAYLHMRMYDLYEDNEYKDIPNFITVDVALHFYHKFFGETLKSIEKKELFPVLQQLTENMIHKTIDLYKIEKDPLLKQDLGEIMVYFSVANQLVNNSYGNIPENLLSVAQEEVEAISKAEGFAKSPLFGFDINYAQFIVRGHYTGDEVLETYFKTMMWYGLIGYPLYDEEKNFDYNSAVKAMLITYLSFQEKEGVNDIALWDKIYSPTDFFVGQSDDLTLFDLKEVMIQVYGKDLTPEDIRNDKYKSLLEKEIDALPSPQIQHKLITGAVDVPTAKQFRFMGQRYTLDANIMQELMFPIIRPVPTGLDVVGAFGSERAESLVKEFYLQHIEPEKYSQELQVMKKKVESLTLADWQQNLYHGWLWVLRSLWTPNQNTEGLPFFMKNQAWEDKNLQSGLGSYAELKHDTVLYAKQPMAEKGGGEEKQNPYPNYVEPAIEVYDRLLWLVQYSKANLEKRQLLSEKQAYALQKLEEIYELLRTCSVKQLENVPISEEENNALKYIGGALEYVDNMLADQYDRPLSSAIISDVAGIADTGEFLEIGTGLPNEILVATYYEGKVYLARGITYGYYEFLNEKPLTDEEWHQMLGVERIEGDGWHYEQINPELLLKNAPSQPQWIHSFKSFEPNKIDIIPVEYNVE